MVRASVTTTVGQNVASHSESRYQALAETVPLLALALEPVHVERDGHSEQARPQREDRVRAVAVERRVDAVRHEVQGGEEGVRESVEIFVADGGEILQADAAIGRAPDIAHGSRR